MEIKYCITRVELVAIPKALKFFQISIQEQLRIYSGAIVKNISCYAGIVAEIQESGRHLVHWLEHYQNPILRYNTDISDCMVELIIICLKTDVLMNVDMLIRRKREHVGRGGNHSIGLLGRYLDITKILEEQLGNMDIGPTLTEKEEERWHPY